MTHHHTHDALPADTTPAALERALEQSHDVKEKVEACAQDLASANEDVKQEIARGATMLPAIKTLEDSENLEAKVQECADDLLGVTDTLAQGIEDLKHIEIALTRARTSLVETEHALTTAQAEEKKATQRALHDSATGLPNRSLFDDRLAHGISLAKRHHWTLAVMFLDLNRFKSINDDHGHAAGDLVLKEVAQRLSRHARDEDTVCRNGGDEFLYLLMNPKTQVDVERVATVVLKNLAQPIEVGGLALVVNSSIGIALYPDDGITGDELIGHADAAMYRAKKGSRGVVLYGAKQEASN